MSSNPASETIEILRHVLSNIERDFDPNRDVRLQKELRRIVLNCITELEIIAIREAPPTGRREILD
jgi:hypothetical protein